MSDTITTQANYIHYPKNPDNHELQEIITFIMKHLGDKANTIALNITYNHVHVGQTIHNANNEPVFHPHWVIKPTETLLHLGEGTFAAVSQERFKQLKTAKEFNKEDTYNHATKTTTTPNTTNNPASETKTPTQTEQLALRIYEHHAKHNTTTNSTHKLYEHLAKQAYEAAQAFITEKEKHQQKNKK